MQKNQSVNLHDAYFKLLMDRRENAAEIITASFPVAIVNKLDLATLKNMKTSFIDKQVRNFQADVVYECNLISGDQITITLLFEHKSYKAKHPHLQLLRYMVRIWESEEKNKDPLNPILPIVFYHGASKWEYKPFLDYFPANLKGKLGFDPDLLKYLPNFDYINVNLQERGDRWITKTIRQVGLRISLFVMRNIRSKSLQDQLEMVSKDFQELKKTEKGREEIKEISIYLSRASEIPIEKIHQIMDRETFFNLPNPVGSPAWHWEQKVRAETKAEARAEARAEAKAEFAINLFKEGFRSKKVAALTGLSLEEVEELEKQNS